MDAQMTNEKFNITLIINIRELSYLLTGSSRTIRKDFVPKQYREDVKLLTDAVEAWDAARMARVKRDADIALCEPSENETEQANAQEEIVQAKEIEARMPAEVSDEDKKPLFRAIPKLKNIYENGRCYRVGNEKGNMHYYKTIEDALWFTK